MSIYIQKNSKSGGGNKRKRGEFYTLFYFVCHSFHQKHFTIIRQTQALLVDSGRDTPELFLY